MARDNTFNIKTPLLKCIVNYFGHLGLQLHPHLLKSYFCLANIAFNISINCIVSYGLSRGDILSFDSYRLQFEHRKPLFGAFLKLCINIFLPGCFLLSRIYCFLNGHKMVQLLESPIISKVYQRSPHFNKLFCAVLLFFHCGYLIFNWKNLKNIFKESDETILDLVSYMSQYAITFAHYLPVVILHYFQYALLCCLRNIEIRLKSDILSNGIKLGKVTKNV